MVKIKRRDVRDPASLFAPVPQVERGNGCYPYSSRFERLLVAKLSDEAAWYNFSEECSNWLKNKL